MANQHTVRAEREMLHRQSINHWEHERRQRVESLCGAITYQRTALRKVSNASIVIKQMAAALDGLHVALAEAINEPNPFDRLPDAVMLDGKRWMVHGDEYVAGEKTGKWVLKRSPDDRRRSIYEWVTVDPSECEVVEEGAS